MKASSSIVVIPIKTDDAMPWLLKRHYAHRRCPISHAFGAYRDKDLVGIITYGVPVSSNLRTGVCGNEWANRVLELNRLCCESTKNLASTLIGKSLSLLPKPSIVISYADIEQGHVGYVYQATNFIYTGLSAKRTDWKIRGLEHLHGATVVDMSRGEKNRATFMRNKFGDNFYLENRARKHRYVFFVGSKKERREMKKALKYPIISYPKGNSTRYNADIPIPIQGILF